MCFLHTEAIRLGFEHAVSIEEISRAYPLLDVIDHAKSRAAVCTLLFSVTEFVVCVGLMRILLLASTRVLFVVEIETVHIF